MAANSLVIDADALAAVRSILVDESLPYTYSDERLILVLRDNRENCLYRNPLFQASSIFTYPILYYGRGLTPLNKSDIAKAHMKPEPGLRSFQCDRTFRHWDSQAGCTVYKNGALQVLTTDYTVDYPQGRVTFTADVNDWEVVTVSRCYYRVYHAARDVLAGHLASGAGNLVSIRLGNDSFTSGPLKDQLYVLDCMLADMTARTVLSGRKMY